ncbi:MAG: PAS domain S-box protein [Candidatus Bathyarchaeia archaeon]
MNKNLRDVLAGPEAFKNLVENASLPIAISDTRGRFVYINRALADALGFQPEEVVGKTFMEFLHPEDKFRVMRLFLRIIALKRQPRALEFRVVCKGGQVRHFISKPTRFIVGGKTLGFQALMTEITELKRMEAQLREANRRFKMLLENAMEGITIVDPNENIIFANRAFAEMLGYNEEEVRGMSLLKFVDEDGFRKISEETEARRKGLVSRYELTLYRKDGKPRFVQVSASPLWNEDGSYAGALAIIMDITERRKMEAALKESEEKFRNIFENANDGFIYLDQHGRILDANRKTVEVLGCRKEEIVGKHFTELQAIPRDELQKVIGAFSAALMEKISYANFTVVGSDGKERLLESSASIIKVGDKISGVLIIARDVTEREQMREKLEEYSRRLETLVEERTKQLREAQERLLRAERLAAIGQVAAMVGHDLRNPLTSIAGAAYYLKKKLWQNMDTKAKKMLRIIERDVEYSNNVLADLLDYSREIKLNFTETTPKALLMETLSTLKVPKKIVVVDEATSDPIIVDKERMKRVFVNIIKNAIAAMPKGGKLIISSRKNGDFMEISFADTGVGMSKEVLEKLWTPFFTTKAKGLGLGLPICKRVVEAHGGEITVKSAPNKGTTFTVAVPVKPKTEKEKEGKVWVKVPESLLSTTTKA